ncbi:MAG: DUF4956 domain-containing protein [Acutalibacteraceae bacterium]|nr:DUF4956 domain-containing protein [Acutalibacteraceae bacterium]
MDSIFNSIFNNGTQATISIQNFLLCLGASLFIGILLAMLYTIKNRYTKSFLVTLAVLPAVVCVVIMMVNGNVGAGVAVAGAFSLVRFRSAPGTAKEIATIFLAMGAGLMTGMGYLAYAVLFAVIVGGIMLIYNVTKFGSNNNGKEKILRITIPEDLDYTDLFDDLFNNYTSEYQVVSVKTTNMGSMFKLTYNVTLKDLSNEKKFIDELRCRNGNLEISISSQEVTTYEL